MFVGHYGVSFAAKPAGTRVPLWVWFIAVQWLDVIWSVLVLMGIEKLRIVPGFTQANPLDLYYMPYSHSLGGSLLLSARRRDVAGLADLNLHGGRYKGDAARTHPSDAHSAQACTGGSAVGEKKPRWRGA